MVRQRTHTQAGRQAGNAQAGAVLQNDLHEIREKSFPLEARPRRFAVLVPLVPELGELFLLDLEVDFQGLLLQGVVCLRKRAHSRRTHATHE